MGTIVFSDLLIKKANDLLDMHDNIKAVIDIKEIMDIIENFERRRNYNLEDVYSLDKRLRADYQEINLIENYANILTERNFSDFQNTNMTIDINMEKLKRDKFGILFSILRKNNATIKVSDFITHVIK